MKSEVAEKMDEGKRVIAVLVLRDILELVLAGQYSFRPLLLQRSEQPDDDFLKEFAVQGLWSALEIIIASLNPESIQRNIPNLYGSDWEKIVSVPNNIGKCGERKEATKSAKTESKRP